MLKKLTKFATTLLAVGLIVFSCMSLVAHAAAPPAFTSATYDAATGSLVITGTNLVAVSGKNNDIQLSKVTITDGLNHSYTLKSKGEVAADYKSATITLTSAEMAGLSFLDKNGTTAINGGTYQILVSAGWNGSSSTADYSAHALTVSNIDSVTSAAYDMATGKLVLTCGYIAPVTGARNDVSPKYITVSDGASHAYTLTTSNVEEDSTLQATITLNAADQIALQAFMDQGGTKTVAGNSYQLTAAFGWNGSQLAQMKPCAITVSNYAGPTVTIKTSSVTLGSPITTAANGIVMNKPGYLYFVPSNTVLTNKTQADLDALVATDKTAISGKVTNVSKVSIPTSGKTVAFKMTGASVDLKAVAVDFTGKLSVLSDNVLTINNIVAPSLSTTVAAGSVVDSTKATATKASADSLAYQFSSTSIATPKVATTVTLATDSTPKAGSIYAYTSASDIVGVSATNKYLGVYELDSSLKVVKFKLITLTASNIKAPALTSATVTSKTLTISCDTLSASSVPATGSFIVKDGTSSNAVTNVAIATDGKSVVLTLTNAVTAGHTITLAYNKPASSALVDAAGNFVASVSAGKLSVSTPTAATSGKATGSVAFAANSDVVTAVGSADKTFTVKVDGSDIAVTIAGTGDTPVATKDALLSAINTALGSAAAATWDSGNHIVITSKSTGASSKIALSGTDVAKFFGTPVIVDGVAGTN